MKNIIKKIVKTFSIILISVYVATMFVACPVGLNEPSPAKKPSPEKPIVNPTNPSDNPTKPDIPVIPVIPEPVEPVVPPTEPTEPVASTKLGERYPQTGAYSPVDKNGEDAGFGWATQKYNPGATLSETTTTFAVYSANATKILLEIYSEKSGVDAIYDYWLEKGDDNYWRAELNGNLTNNLYAFRAWGPNWEFSEDWTRGNSEAGFVSDYDTNGNRFNPNKVLFDPYAKELSHDKSNPEILASVDTGIYGSGADEEYGTIRRNFDTGKFAPKSVIINDSTNYGTKPRIEQKDALIYEAHVRGLTNHSSSANLSSILSGFDGFENVADIPDNKRGTYAGAALMAPYLKALGINTIELLPVHETDNDCNPDDGSGGNFWGYMTFGYFAPDRRYSSDKTYGGPTREFKEMVKSFHDAGIEVYLDVVYNHSGEGGYWSSEHKEKADLLSMKGLDNSSWYCICEDGAGFWETTGCGNNLRCDTPMVRQFILDSLGYWIDIMGVDGFRFDLAPVLGREQNGNGWSFSQSATTIKDIASLGEDRNVEMIAEAWDCQYPEGYQVGQFPNGWGEWNGRFRDSLRKYVGAGNATEQGGITNYINGDYNNFYDQGGAHKSVNFVVAHDGFTLADLCSYEGAGNAQNSTLTWPFGPSDGGNGDNNSLSFGTEQANKRQAARNYIALQMISRGVPMIVYGDEFSRTQNGNNNPYNIDSVATWNNYNMINTSSPHQVATGSSGNYHNNFGTFANDKNKNGNFEFMRYMLNLRANEPALRQSGYNVTYDFKKEDGSSALSDGDRCIWIRIDGSSVQDGSDYLVLSNMYTSKIDFTIPSASSGKVWKILVDTDNWAENSFNCFNESTQLPYYEEKYGVNPWSVVILKEVSSNYVQPTTTINKGGVMLQGFNWASAPRTDLSRHGTWYKIMQAQSSLIKDTFECVWFPPASKTSSGSPEGYCPTELNDLNNYYGTEDELKAVIDAIKPAKAIGDIVVNHRDGNWGDFANPTWDVVSGVNYKAICSDDEGFTGDTEKMGKSALSMRGNNDTGAGFDAARDLDHTNTVVQNGIIDWMNNILMPVGFVGWRYDYVKGFGGQYVGLYNQKSNTQFSVGEYWPTGSFDSNNPAVWGNEIKNWISKTEQGGYRSRAFDFALKGIMNSVFGCNSSNVANSNYGLLANAASLMQSQAADAVTFVDNHDTGSTQAHWYLDPADVGTAYAFILTHPGFPCVAWQHYFTDAQSGNHNEAQYIGGNTVPGTDKTYREHIDYLIELRKTVGIECDDTTEILSQTGTCYAAKVAGTNGELVVVIGNGYKPTGEGYDGNNPIYKGTNFKIWQKGESGEVIDEPEPPVPSGITLNITVPDWVWNDNAIVYAWVWGGSYGEGQWILCSNKYSKVTFTLDSEPTAFKIVRYPPTISSPNWDSKWNESSNIQYQLGISEYTASI